jgi:multiple sugar transport system substrate-binding protein
MTVEWAARPLSGFELQPIAELAREHDLVILDHPFTGDIAKAGCLLPLDALLEGTAKNFVGPTLETYRYGGHIWALPVDAACQVAVSRPDLLRELRAEVPKSFSEVMSLGELGRRRSLKLAIALQGVHALMTFFTMMASLGAPCATDPDAELCDAPAAREVLRALRALVRLCPDEVLSWNSIALHDQMVGRDDLMYCPAVYCYATYAEADQRAPLRFHDLPGLASARPAGSTIGGAGFGISASCREPAAAFSYARYLFLADTQRRFAALHGQPARVEAWEDAEIDERFGGCFTATRQTMEGCWIRPRYPGYLSFQEKAGALLEHHLRGDLAEPSLMDALRGLHETAGRTREGA